MSIAIFILPKDPLKSELIRWKNKIKKIMPSQPYALHPPHMTLINIEIEDEVGVPDIISSIDLNVTPFKIEVTTKDVFWNDIVTGGHTLYFNVCQNKNLLKIQNNIAQSLQPLRKKVPNPYDPIDNKIFYESFEKYGFPYTGLNWKPHFTVASIRTNKTNPIITEFLSINSKYNFIIDQFSIWDIQGDKHVKLKTVYIK